MSAHTFKRESPNIAGQKGAMENITDLNASPFLQGFKGIDRDQAMFLEIDSMQSNFDAKT